MKGKDVTSSLERRVTTLDGCFEPLMSALHAYEEKSRPCLPGDLLMKSGEDAVNEMYDVLESVERCESLYSAVMRETSRCFEVSEDLMYLIKSVEEKCRSDYVSILAMKKSAIVMLEASEKRLSCEEMRMNAMRREVLMTKLSTNEAEEIARQKTCEKQKMRRSVKKEKMMKPKRMSEIRSDEEKESSCLSVTRPDHTTCVTQQKTKYPRILFGRSDRTRQSGVKGEKMSSVDKNEKLSRSEKSQRQLEEDEHFLSVEEKAKLVVWSGRQHMKAVFDSEVDCMGRGSAKFYKTISRCDGVVIVIDSTNGCRFGVFVGAKVEKNGEYITDENAFVFLLRDNGKEKMKKFCIKEKKEAFCVGVLNSSCLFTAGNEDLKVPRKIDGVMECSLQMNSYDYGIEKCPFGMERQVRNLEVDKFVVFDMRCENNSKQQNSEKDEKMETQDIHFNLNKEESTININRSEDSTRPRLDLEHNKSQI